MKPILFCSILIAIFSFSCKPKPLDNLKEVALTVEENKVKRMSRHQIAAETQRVADSVLTVIKAEQQQKLTQNPNDVALCLFTTADAYFMFQKKYNGRLQQLQSASEIKALQAEMENLRQYRNELSEPAGNFPATFQTLTDSLLYVRPVKAEELICAPEKNDVGAEQHLGYWVFRMPKQKLIEIKTVKVKPKPAKGPNW
ncbi:hypothetical protein [Adhaeribacter soli]|uniref:Lipoprotein n=1 Tax=Adhaeribacter soli TaxID=2607655 RepID=A0A5N1IPF8_9BACT|nr:hypothetical protein [Adhaeribacter soli]KAA9331894.1 hypothetical protein F0P94_13935 [Adhaeribacter soli]